MAKRLLGIVMATSCALIGCKKAKDEGKKPPAVSAPVVIVDAGPPPIDAVAIDAPPPPLTPAIGAGKIGLQVIDLEYGGIVAPGIPAIKGDGSEVVVVSSADDGGRGYLDLEVVFLDAKTGAPTKKIQVSDPNATSDSEGDSAIDKVSTRKAVDDAAIARVAEVNAALATGDWRALKGTTPLDRSDSTVYTDEITLDDLTYKLNVGKQVLTIARAGKTVSTAKLTKLYKVPKSTGDESCGDDRPFLSAIYVDAATAKAVIAVDFIPGGHNCGSAGAAYTVVPLPQ